MLGVSMADVSGAFHFGLDWGVWGVGVGVLGGALQALQVAGYAAAAFGASTVVALVLAAKYRHQPLRLAIS